MLKLIIYITKLIVITITALFFASCNFNGRYDTIEGNGTISTQNRNINGTFTKIEVENSIELIIEQSDSTSIVVEADDRIIDKITTTIDNGTLTIQFEKNSFSKVYSTKVTVKLPEIHKIEASSGATVRGQNTFKSDYILVDASSGSEINIQVETDKVAASASSGSSVTLQGMALELEVDASSGAEINAQDLEANDINADASSGASIIVYPIVSLKAEATSAAGINYVNIPKTIDKQSSSGGSVSQN